MWQVKIMLQFYNT